MMDAHTIYDTATGQILGVGAVPEGQPLEDVGQGRALVAGAWPAYLYSIDLKSGTPIKRAIPSPSPLIAQAQRMACDRINAARDQALAAGMTWNGHQFDTDPASISRVTGAAALALLNPAYETDWILADNTTIHLANADVRALGEAMGAFVSGLIWKARSLKIKAMSTTTVADCEAIQWA